jgi:hypothetical protein
MPFSDAFSIANPFSVNPQYSNTPQAAQAKAAQVKAHTPVASSIPKPATEENSIGAEALSAARTSPLLEALGNHAPTPQVNAPQNAAMPQFAAPTPPQVYPNMMPPQNQYLAQLLASLSQSQAIQQAQRMYPNRLVYV